nr:reverse transcriptase domain-containing protein [Tanacetum cinerariifolium]
MLRACPYHRFTEFAQIDTFYNGLNDNDQDPLNAAAGGNLLSKTTREALQIIENKSKVCYSKNKSKVSRKNMTSRENARKSDDRIDKLADQISTLVDIFAKKVVTPVRLKRLRNLVLHVVDLMLIIIVLILIETNQVFVWRRVVERETEETTDKEQTNFHGSTAHIQPSVTLILEPDVLKTLPKSNITYPLRLNDQKLREKATNQMEKFFQIFQDFHFDTSFADALLLMPKFSSTIKSLLTNKDKLFELAKIPLNKNCSAMLLKKLLEKLGDPENFLYHLKDESISLEINHVDCDLEGDICLIEKLLNDDPFQLPLMELKQGKVVKEKSSVEESRELELKDLPSHLEYAYLEDCIDAFETLKKKLTESLILVVPDWNLPFELMCDVSDFAIGAVLGQLYAFEKFRPYLVLSKSIVYTAHLALKYLLSKQDAKPRDEMPQNVIQVCEIFDVWGIDFIGPFSSSRRNRTPIAIISDRMTHFCNDKFAKVMSKYGVNHRLSTAYHPQIKHKEYWVLKHVNFDFKTTGDHRKLQLNELNELRDQAYENSLIYKEKTKKLHDSKIKNRIFNVGDRVLLFNSRLKIFSRKLKSHWSGPFTITKVFPYETVELSQPDGPNFKVDGHRMKHYFRGDVP